jgi:hypothetical protein
MKVTLADKSIACLALISGLSISAVAVYYSVAGLISIFAAAAIPIAIMGIVLELSKLVATVWLKQNWFIAPRLIRAYLLIAVAILMFITSMGIFGYLSKAHLDQAVPTGDVVAQVALIDEKIKTERDNIDTSKKALQQMDAQVDQMLGRSDTERGAERAVAIRKNQAKERISLQADIAKSQKAIAVLNQERAPVASELRKVEAEVGPIKYIAALLYGDNPDTNVLERAVRWVIILIVIIFDPLAVVMLLASQYSFQYFRRQREDDEAAATEVQQEIVDVPTSAPIDDAVDLGLDVVPEQPVAVDEPAEDHGNCHGCGTALVEAKGIDIFCPNKECDYDLNTLDTETKDFFAKLREINREIDEEERASEANTAIAHLDDTEPAAWPFPEMKLEDNIIVDKEEQTHDAVDNQIIDSKQSWKAANPDDTLKRQRTLYERGLIETLPWDVIEQYDADNGALTDEQITQMQETIDRSEEVKKKDELHNQTEESTDQKEEIEYIQNSEQTSDSIWSRIKDQKN